MKVTDLLGLLGGLALFLYGMQMMSLGLESVAGNKMKRILEKLTVNRFLGIMVGAGITAAIQSSSGTTIMVVGFVSTGIMTLNQAVWIIMGANVGTTITGQLIALDIGLVAPLFAFVGVALIAFTKNKRLHNYGNIVAGFGVLFIGMGMMSKSMIPLRQSDVFIDAITQFGNPLIGNIAGAIFTAVIQSSSASVGILQALAMSGVITLPTAVYVLFGQNIGTCITAALASIGASRNAKRAMVIHLLFNVIGTTIFTVLCVCLPLADYVASFTPENPALQIANMHTLFNVATTLLLIPFGNFLVDLTKKILPDRESDAEEYQQLVYIKPMKWRGEHILGTSAMAIEQINGETFRMLEMARANVEDSFASVLNMDITYLAKVTKCEEYIDFLNHEIARFISNIIAYEANERDSATISSYFKIIGNIERISDHSINICEYVTFLKEQKIDFSQGARQEITAMQSVSLSVIDMLQKSTVRDAAWLAQIADFEQEIDDKTVAYRQNQVDRMKQGVCSENACTIYSEMLTDFERIGDHLMNIGRELHRISVNNSSRL